MRENRRRLCLALLVFMGATTSSVVLGEEICDPTKSEQACEEAVRQKLRPNEASGAAAADFAEGKAAFKAKVAAAYLEAGRASAPEELARAIVPLSNLASSAEVSRTDFASLLSLLIDSGSFSNDEQALQIDMGRVIGLPKSLRLAVNVRQPEVFAPLSMALGETEGAPGAEELKKGLSDFADVSVELKYSPQERKENADSRLVRELHNSIRLNADSVMEGDPTLVRIEDLDAEWTRAKDEVQDFIAGVAQIQEDEVSDDPSVQSRLIELVEVREVARATYLNALEAPLREYGFFRLGELFANRPKWVVEAEYVRREDAAGPDTVRGALSYEQGWPNVRQVRKRCFDRGVAEQASCFRKLLDDSGPKVEKGHGVKLKAEYSEIDDFRFALGDGLDPFEAVSEDSLTVAASYGVNLAFDETLGIATRRLEVTLDHEDVAKDSLRNDRQKIGLTLTQRINDETSLSLGAVWASDPEFRGEVEHEVSAKFGLSYKFLGSKKKEASSQ